MVTMVGNGPKQGKSGFRHPSGCHLRSCGAVESAWGQHPSGPDSVCAGCSGNVRALCDRGSEPSFATDVRAASLEESESHSAKAGQADLKL